MSNPAAPAHLQSISTDCGSHTHTLVPDAANGRVLLYVSSYPLGAAAQGPNCVRLEDGGGYSKISIVDVPLANPKAATVTAYNLDSATEWATFLNQFTLRACHDISVFTELKLAAAACMSEAQLWDISDPSCARAEVAYVARRRVTPERWHLGPEQTETPSSFASPKRYGLASIMPT